MYKLGRLIGMGANSCFFAIRWHPRLGVKISFSDQKVDHKELLTEELQKAKYLHSIGIPVPKFVGLIKVKIPDHIEKTIARANPQHWERHTMEHVLFNSKNEIFYALVMEKIETDLFITSKHKEKRIEKIYNLERQKIKEKGIKIYDSKSSHNVLWSKNKAKLYFIDFEFWEF